jgi:hypothetical protein
MEIKALELPLNTSDAPPLAGRRVDHLLAACGGDEAAATRLGRAFPSLAAVYRAGSDELAAVVGPVLAARLRWFLDAPMATGQLPVRGSKAA